MISRAKDLDAAAPLLSIRHIVKRFGGNIAVNDVSLNVFPGQVVALLGENGAGKSTLLKVLAGVYNRDGGEILYCGRQITSAATLKRKNERPISFIHQDLGLVEWMTVAENMAMVMGFPHQLGLVNWQRVRHQAKKALESVGVDLDPDTRVFDLSRTEKSLLAIARAVAVDAAVLILDEPTASLPADDVNHLFKVMNVLREKKVGMIYITHRLDEVLEIADEVCVMRDGCYVGGGSIKDYTLRGLVELIVGEAVRDDYRLPLPDEKSPVVLNLKDVCVGDTGPISFSLRAGEMVALSGLRGAGQEEIGRLLFACRNLSKGEISLCNKTFQARTQGEAMAAGVSFVAGDRLGESLVTSMTVRENLSLNPFTLGYRLWSRYDEFIESASCWRKVSDFDVRPKEINIEVSALSGGNQQKVVIARWLSLGTPLLILEDPTAGVDVAARAEIYNLLNEALRNKVAILVISNDLEEVAQICNRALVFNRGHIVGELRNEDVTFANLLELASGSRDRL